MVLYVFFFQAEDGIRDIGVTGVQTCALPIWPFDFSVFFVPRSSNFPHWIFLSFHFLPPNSCCNPHEIRKNLFLQSDIFLSQLGLKNFCHGKRPIKFPDSFPEHSLKFHVNTNPNRSEEHTSELQSRQYLVCRLLLEKKKKRTHDL